MSGFTYDAAMRESSRTLGNGLTKTTYARADHLPTALTVTTSGGPALPGLGWSYTYDANKNLASATTGSGGA